MICPMCARSVRALPFVVMHFNVHDGRAGAVRTQVQLCSLTCIVRWTIQYGLQLGQRSVRKFLGSLPKKG